MYGISKRCVTILKNSENAHKTPTKLPQMPSPSSLMKCEDIVFGPFSASCGNRNIVASTVRTDGIFNHKGLSHFYLLVTF